MRDSVASSGPDAVAMLRQESARGDLFRIVILDMQMPGLDGLQIVEQIRADPTVAGAKLVQLALLESGELRDGVRSAVDAFLTKPVKQSQLLKTLCAVIGGKPAASPASQK